MTDGSRERGSNMATKKAVCVFCKGSEIKKRKLSYGYYCASCRVAFREPLFLESEKTEA